MVEGSVELGEMNILAQSALLTQIKKRFFDVGDDVLDVRSHQQGFWLVLSRQGKIIILISAEIP